jgi:hypothetical protein
MEATETPSIWLERTDARVGLEGELIGQLEWCVGVGLRSKQGSGRRGRFEFRADRSM